VNSLLHVTSLPSVAGAAGAGMNMTSGPLHDLPWLQRRQPQWEAAMLRLAGTDLLLLVALGTPLSIASAPARTTAPFPSPA
jgi:hypothetical protein